MPALLAFIALHRHLGYASWDYTPTGRGFGSYLGYMQGETDYYNKTSGAGGRAAIAPGYDFWANRTLVPRDDTLYTMEAYAAETERLTAKWAADASSNTPFFLYYAIQTVHTPLEDPPQAQHLANCAHVTSSS